MVSKKQTHSSDNTSSKQHSPKPATENIAILAQQSILSATLVQSARIASGRLNLRQVVQLQPTIGNRAVCRLLIQATQKVSPASSSAETPGKPVAGNQYVQRVMLQRQPAVWGLVQRQLTDLIQRTPPEAGVGEGIADQVVAALDTPDPIAGVGDFAQAYTILSNLNTPELLPILDELNNRFYLEVLLSGGPFGGRTDIVRIMAEMIWYSSIQWRGVSLRAMQGRVQNLLPDHEQETLARHIIGEYGSLGQGVRIFPVQLFVRLQYQHIERRAREEAERRRQAEIERRRQAGETNPEVPEVEVSPGEIIEEEVEQRRFQTRPTDRWDNMSELEKQRWRQRAATAWQAVQSSVRGTELENVVNTTTFNFDPRQALEKSWYAWQSGNTLNVGMSWVELAEQDPRNIWENIAHEMAGHREYGATYSSQIVQGVLNRLPAAERQRILQESQGLFEAISYSETEIYSHLRALRYRMPPNQAERPSGGVHPHRDIPHHLRRMLDWFEPMVLNAVLSELNRRIQDSSEILDRDKAYFVTQVQQICSVQL